MVIKNIHMFFKKILKNPGLLFMKHRYSRSFYSYISLTINNIFESKQKREWQQKLYQENSNKIDDKLGYLLTDDSFFKNSQLIMKVYSDTNSIISKNIENQGGSKSFLKNILDINDLEKFPSILKLGLEPKILSTVSTYLKSSPLLVKVKLLKSKVNNDLNTSSQLFHLDHDDRNNVKVFIHLNDVDRDTGPFTLVAKDLSKKFANEKNYKYIGKGSHIKEADASSLYKKQIQVLGPKGTVLLVDTCNVFHYGSAQNIKERYVLYFHYVKYSSFTYSAFFLNLLPQKFLKNYFPYLRYAKNLKDERIFALGANRL